MAVLRQDFARQAFVNDVNDCLVLTILLAEHDEEVAVVGIGRQQLGRTHFLHNSQRFCVTVGVQKQGSVIHLRLLIVWILVSHGLGFADRCTGVTALVQRKHIQLLPVVRGVRLAIDGDLRIRGCLRELALLIFVLSEEVTRISRVALRFIEEALERRGGTGEIIGLRLHDAHVVHHFEVTVVVETVRIETLAEERNCFRVVAGLVRDQTTELRGERLVVSVRFRIGQNLIHQRQIRGVLRWILIRLDHIVDGLVVSLSRTRILRSRFGTCRGRVALGICGLLSRCGDSRCCDSTTDKQGGGDCGAE